LAHNHVFILDRDHKKLVWHPDGGPDLAEFTRDIAPGGAGVLTDVHLTEQAKRHNAVGGLPQARPRAADAPSRKRQATRIECRAAPRAVAGRRARTSRSRLQYRAAGDAAKSRNWPPVPLPSSRKRLRPRPKRSAVPRC